MPGEMVAEAIWLMSSTSQSDIEAALQTAFYSSSPPISASTLASAVEDWKSPTMQFQLLPISLLNLERHTLPHFQLYGTPEGGLQAGFPDLDPVRLWKEFPASANKTGSGESLGAAIVGSATARAGGLAGAAIGSLLGPIGSTVGGIIGGVYAGIASRQIALQEASGVGGVGGVGGVTDYEVNQLYQIITLKLAQVGFEPDPKQTRRKAVEAAVTQWNSGDEEIIFDICTMGTGASGVMDLRTELLKLYEESPQVFGEFVGILRAARYKL